MIDKFEQHSTTEKKSYGWVCNCKKGLWGVTAPTKQQAIDTGYYYFVQYWENGEYLSPEMQMEILMKKLSNG